MITGAMPPGDGGIASGRTAAPLIDRRETPRPRESAFPRALAAMLWGGGCADDQ
jgi:hypothetical protein